MLKNHHGWLRTATLVAFLFFVTAGCPKAKDTSEGFDDSSNTGDAEEVSIAAGAPGTGTVYAASLAAGGGLSAIGPAFAVISEDGRWVALISSARDLIAGLSITTPRAPDTQLYLHDPATKTNRLVSHVAGSSTTTSNGAARAPKFSADGRYVVWQSLASNVGGQVPPPASQGQVYRYDTETGENRLVSHAAGTPGVGGNGGSRDPRVSEDGRWVLYFSFATNLVPEQVDSFDPRGAGDAFLYDCETAETTLVSRTFGTQATATNGSAEWYALSRDGRWVAHHSKARDLVKDFSDGNGSSGDLFLFDAASGTNTLITASAVAAGTTSGNRGVGDESPAISDDGRFVAFSSSATDLVAKQSGDDGADIYLYDRQSGRSVLVSHGPSSPTLTSGWTAISPAISGDGRWVAYSAEGDNLVAGQIQDGPRSNAYLYDRESGRNELVSHVAGDVKRSPEANSYAPVISRDGRFLAYSGEAENLVPGQIDEPWGSDVFLYDRETRASTLVSHAPGSSKQATNGPTTDRPTLADNGRVAFLSFAETLVEGDTNGEIDAFLFIPDE